MPNTTCPKFFWRDVEIVERKPSIFSRFFKALIAWL
jgi:hypothetical protein